MGGIDRAATGRRGALECMVWAGTGVLWTLAGGVPRSAPLGEAHAAEAGFSFVQISDSHIGFAHAANMDTPATLQAAVDQARAAYPAFLLHTGDVSHLSKPAQFDAAAAIVGSAGIECHYVPGEHDVLGGGAGDFVARFQPRVRQPVPNGACYSFDQAGVHFVALNNVSDLGAGGLGRLGPAQLAWLRDDLRGRAASQPIVVFAHIPLWTVYAPWGWGTDDAAQALALLARFGSVTVLNGHIHQVVQKVEGHVAFHTARSTAFPQPAPGSAGNPGPVTVPPGRLRSVLGVTSVSYVPGGSPLAVIRDASLDAPRAGRAAAAAAAVDIGGFAFSPPQLTVAVGTRITWTNHDDMPHTVTHAGTPRLFGSPPLDTGERYDRVFDRPGTYRYVCSIHPHMQGVVVVR